MRVGLEGEGGVAGVVMLLLFLAEMRLGRKALF
jgi:hypothetical protein